MTSRHVQTHPSLSISVSSGVQAGAMSARLRRMQTALALEAVQAARLDVNANVPRSVPRPPMARFEHRGKAGAVF